MSEATLTIDGVTYTPNERQLELLEAIRQEHYSELEKIDEENPFNGALDGPRGRLKRESLDRMRKRVRDLMVNGIEP